MRIFLSNLWKWINDAVELIAPKQCVICRRRLCKEEHSICISCYSKLPFTNIKARKGNKIERLFWEKIPIVRANSFLYYLPQSESSNIFLSLKYKDRPQIGYYFGRMMANDLIDTDFFNGIDYIIPLPLAKERLLQRGYNQSESLAKGISAITQIPLDTRTVVRTISNPTQTRLKAEERIENVKNIFQITNHERLSGMHVLLVDDILTTGATLMSCAQELAKIHDIRISVLTLGLAGCHYSIEKEHYVTDLI